MAFAGQIASGKSTYSEILAKELGWPRYSFGAFVSDCARKLGLDPDDRETLQDLGLCLAKRPERFCKAFLAWTGRPDNCVVDGLRHAQMLRMLRNEEGEENVRVVFIDTSEITAVQRHGNRGRDGGQLETIRAHLVETEISSLRGEANWIVSGERGEGLAEVIHSLRGYVEMLAAQTPKS